MILGYDVDGQKDILGLWLSESESKHQWMQIFDEIKARGVEDVFFISMDGVSGLEQGAKAVFPDVVVQRCIVHLERNVAKLMTDRRRKAMALKVLKSVFREEDPTFVRAAYHAAIDAIEKLNPKAAELLGIANYQTLDAQLKRLGVKWKKQQP